jgi:AcrR family transcriptional regulator
VVRPYMSRAVRRKQIVDATLRLVSQYGVKGATLNRVAAEVGLTTPSLYGHFSSRRELLLEAMDTLFEKVRELHRSASHPSALERLRQINLGYMTIVSSEEGFSLTLFEFIAAPPDEDLREVLGGKELMLVEELTEIVRDGQRQGTIRKEMDPYQIAWMMVSRAWTDDVTHLMGIADHWIPERSHWMLDHILEVIAAPDVHHLETPVSDQAR